MQLSRRQRTALEQLRKTRECEPSATRGILLQAAVTLGPAAMVGAAWIAIFASLGFFTLAALMVGLGLGFVTAVIGYNRENAQDWGMMMAIIDWDKVDAAIATNVIEELKTTG